MQSHRRARYQPDPGLSVLLAVATAALALVLAPAAVADDSPVNLHVTDAVRGELVSAAAATTNGIPASEFTGLRPGQTYYAYQPDDQIYWAAAGLVPGPSLRSQVATQDAGSYYIFRKPEGGSWTAFLDGAGVNRDRGCPAGLPATVQSLWQWPTGRCAPP
jgi:hypothetical protein